MAEVDAICHRCISFDKRLSEIRAVWPLKPDPPGCYFDSFEYRRRAGSDSAKEFSHHISFAYGSLMEAETQLQIAANLGYIEQAEADRLLNNAAEIGRMLNGLSRSIRH